MNDVVTPDQNTPPKRTHLTLRLTLVNLQIVAIVALVIATLFTAWTPGESSQAVGWEISRITPIPTPIPTMISAVLSGAVDEPSEKLSIGIVAGHWGNDSGAVCPDGFTEVELNQMIATLVQKKLVESGYAVDLFREFDPKLSGYQAQALVSIHADSCVYYNDQATGFKVAAALANPNPERATRLTACLRARYGQATGLPLHSTSVTNDMTDYHAFKEIDKTTVAAIIETGFLNRDRQFLTEHPDLAAQGIVEGIQCFLNDESLQVPEVQPTP